MFGDQGNLRGYEDRDTAGHDNEDRTDEHDGEIVRYFSADSSRRIDLPYGIERIFDVV